jgi:hypothetical protein
LKYKTKIKKLRPSLHKTKTAWIIILIGMLLFIVIDRGYWATVSQWREDQATNIWLGYTRSPISLPVGLISSINNIPNPNGMPLLGEVLSRLPDLWWVSTALGILQGLLVMWVSWLLLGPGKKFFLLALPALASVILGASSVEFWNQWVMTSLNLLFFGLLITYLRGPSIWKALLLILPMLAAPALYLAGLDNAIVFFILSLAVVIYKRPHGSRRTWIVAGGICVLVVGLAFRVTWLPYLRAIDGYSLPGAGMTLEVAKTRLANSALTAIRFPVWWVMQWANPNEAAFYQSSSQILPASAVGLLNLTRILGLVQSVLSLGSLLVALVLLFIRKLPLNGLFYSEQRRPGMILLAGMALVFSAFTLSPLLGGPVWASADRIDQSVQFLPFFLFAWFALPFVVRLPGRVAPAAKVLTILLLAGFVGANLIAGVQVISAHLDYRGSYLSSADVPLIEKEQAVNFIARDWVSRSSEKTIGVTYDLGGGVWDYVPDFGQGLMMWYPSPMTMGRSFDYELLRVYGLTNNRENVQIRPLFPTHYLVSYAFLPEPSQPGIKFTNYLFGRLRVSVVQ